MFSHASDQYGDTTRNKILLRKIRYRVLLDRRDLLNLRNSDMSMTTLAYIFAT